MKTECIQMKTECKGLFFRGHNCTYVTESKSQTVIGQKIFLTSLKKMSCPGCPSCGGIIDGIQGGSEVDLGNIEDKKVYKLCWTSYGILPIKVFEG